MSGRQKRSLYFNKDLVTQELHLDLHRSRYWIASFNTTRTCCTLSELVVEKAQHILSRQESSGT